MIKLKLRLPEKQGDKMKTNNPKFDTFKDYLKTIEDEKQNKRMEEILIHIIDTFPQLETAIKWSQPTFTDHGTFIVAFSTAKKHISFAPEHVSLEKFEKEFKEAGYNITKMLVQIPNNKEVDYELLDKVIEFNIEYKKDFDKFWLLPTR